MNVCPWTNPVIPTNSWDNSDFEKFIASSQTRLFWHALFSHAKKKPKGLPTSPPSNATFLPSWSVAKKGLSHGVNGGLLILWRPYLLGRNVALGELYPQGSNHLLRMVMEPKYLATEVIIHPNHHLTRWLDPSGIDFHESGQETFGRQQLAPGAMAMMGWTMMRLISPGFLVVGWVLTAATSRWLNRTVKIT